MWHIFILLIVSCFKSHAFIDITTLGHEQYQDIIINNVIVKQASHNHKDCDTRYTIIKELLNHYSRPFTLLDLGAAQGYYSFRTAWDFRKSVCVMIEGNNEAYPYIGTQLLQLCEENSMLSNIILLNKKIVIDDLHRLAECEHFDVVLCMNIVHWFRDQWQMLIQDIELLGDNIIVETPPVELCCPDNENKLRNEIISYLQQKNAVIIGDVPRHTSNIKSHLYLLRGNRKYVKRRTWLSKNTEKNTHYIYSTFNEKKLIKQPDWPPNTQITSQWVPGINLVTFKMYNGSFPHLEKIEDIIKKLIALPSNDWMPNNMILQGNNITLIDCDDPNHNPGGLGGGKKYSPSLLQKILKWVHLKDTKAVEQFFWTQIVN